MATENVPRVAIVEVTPSDEYSEGNPFTATVVTEEYFLHGEVRIEPPFTPGYSIDSEYAWEGTSFEHRFTTNKATILDFTLQPGNATEDAETENENAMIRQVEGEMVVLYDVRKLLNDLGRVANKALFTKLYEKLEQ